LWQEATQIKSHDERLNFLKTTVVNRLESLTELANAYGTPWYARLEASKVDENWHRGY
jgi:hypothetical protein